MVRYLVNLAAGCKWIYYSLSVTVLGGLECVIHDHVPLQCVYALCM